MPGFGDAAAQIIALVLILAAFGLFKKKSKNVNIVNREIAYAYY